MLKAKRQAGILSTCQLPLATGPCSCTCQATTIHVFPSSPPIIALNRPLSMSDDTTKWEGFYSRQFTPWDSGRPSSQLVAYVTSCCADWPRAYAASCTSAAHHEVACTHTSSESCNQVPTFLPEGFVLSAATALPLHICDHCAGLKPGSNSQVLEIGCGTGSSCIFLASKGFQVVGVDIVQDAVKASTAAAKAAGISDRCVFVQHDIYQLPNDFCFEVAQRYPQLSCPSSVMAGSSLDTQSQSTPMQVTQQRAGCQIGHFDLIYDCQTFHVLREVNEQELLSKIHQLLRPGGLVLLLTGNANEPYVGPNVLTDVQIKAAFPEHLFELVWMIQTRFDDTQHYETVVGYRPLAWWVLYRRRVV